MNKLYLAQWADPYEGTVFAEIILNVSGIWLYHTSLSHDHLSLEEFHITEGDYLEEIGEL